MGYLFLVLIAVLNGCESDKTAEVRMVRKKEVLPARLDVPISSDTEKIDWTVPKSWIEKEPSGMRLATFLIADTQNKEAILAEGLVMRLSGGAGGLVPNVNRWREELGLSELAENQMADLIKSTRGKMGSFHYVELAGEDAAAGAMWAAMIPFGDSTLVVKWLGAKNAIAAHRTSFVSFAKSIHPSA